MRLVAFANPEFLLLAPLALLVAWWWARRRRPALRFSDTTLFSGLGRGRARRAVWGGALLRGAAGLALVVACAGPRVPDERTRLPAEAVAIMMVLDVSGSMETEVPWAAGEKPVTRLEAARRALKLFLEGGTAPDGTHFEPRPSDQVGLVKLAAVPYTVCPLTLNHTVLLKVADELKPEVGLQAGTNVGDGLAEALIRLDAAAGVKTKVVILLSDGQHTQTREGKDATLRPREAAQLAANLGIKVYTIDAGGDPSLLRDAAERAEREEGKRTLQDVAAMTSARYFEAADGTGMLAAYRDIDALERVRVETYQYRRYFEFYWWCAAAAAALLLAAHLLDRTAWRTVP